MCALNFFRKIAYSFPPTRKFCLWRINVLPFIKLMKLKPKAVIFMLTPEHTNLGDHALAYSTQRLFDLAEIDYIEVTGVQLKILERNNALGIFNGRNIVFNGGGNLGTLWPDVESITRKILKLNFKSQFVFLPNTIYYEDNEFGNAEMKKSIDFYDADNIRLYAREKPSYDVMTKLYRNVSLCPDLVLSIDFVKDNKNRNGCLICLRNDIEKTLSKEDNELIIKNIRKIFNDNYVLTDTHADHYVSVEERKGALESKLGEFKAAELVVTDRLHGMIFAAITGTPCIVVNSKSPKVKGCYEWIRELDYICFCDDLNMIPEIYNQIPKKNHVYNNGNLKHYYDDLISYIKKMVEKEI